MSLISAKTQKIKFKPYLYRKQLTNVDNIQTLWFSYDLEQTNKSRISIILIVQNYYMVMFIIHLIIAPILSCGMSCLSIGQTLCWFDRGPAAFLWESEGHYCKGATILEWGDCASNQGRKESVDCCSWEQFERHCEALRR